MRPVDRYSRGMIQRRRFLTLAAAGVVAPFTANSVRAGIDHLPLDLTFRGQARYRAIMDRAKREGWGAMPIGKRVARIGTQFIGVPYKGFTLEIHDRVECPSANCDAMDCWTFFEIALCMARLLERPKREYTPSDLLKEIQWTRYRAGRCTGNYLERIHYLNEWFIDNEARGNVKDITRQLPGAQRLHGRRSREMTILWKSYRYLRRNPELRAGMAKIEEQVDRLPVYYIPRSKVAAIESQLADGDIAGIVTKHQGGVCSHVGLILRDSQGRARFLHASKNHKQVHLDSTISGYLNSFSSHAGLMVARPLSTRSEITSRAQYEANLRTLTRA